MSSEVWRIIVAEMRRLCSQFGGTWDFAFSASQPLAVNFRWFSNFGRQVSYWSLDMTEEWCQRPNAETEQVVRVRIQCAIMERAMHVFPVEEDEDGERKAVGNRA